MIRLPEGNLGKALAVAAGAVSVAAIYAVAIEPLMSFYGHGRQTLQERLEVLHRVEASAAELPRLRAAAKEWREKTRDGDLLFVGSSDAVAGAALQSTLKELIEDGSATLSSAEVLPAETADKFRRVAIRVSFSGDLTLITDVLRGIEGARPAIFVDNLDIRTAGDSARDDEGKSFTIAFDVHGFRPL